MSSGRTTGSDDNLEATFPCPPDAEAFRPPNTKVYTNWHSYGSQPLYDGLDANSSNEHTRCGVVVLWTLSNERKVLRWVTRNFTSSRRPHVPTMPRSILGGRMVSPRCNRLAGISLSIDSHLWRGGDRKYDDKDQIVERTKTTRGRFFFVIVTGKNLTFLQRGGANEGLSLLESSETPFVNVFRTICDWWKGFYNPQNVHSKI